MTNPAPNDEPAGEAHGLDHVMPVRVLLTIWVLLMVFTALTVMAAQMHLGALEIWVAMGIATFKATLVALYFMHLRYDRPFHGVIVIGALLFVLLFVGLTMLDSAASNV